MARRKRHGFGYTKQVHGDSYRESLRGADSHLRLAKQSLKQKNCSGAMNQVVAAREHAEAAWVHAFGAGFRTGQAGRARGKAYTLYNEILRKCLLQWAR